ncbi:hypothetical protein HanRHA438_Chr08g0352931 [Helianthus annuus]|nr:hypothetical protein HanHA300_Chr08g0276561 [Helianthus annuus]KAJ0553197.1 hypothetical protein HanHA89_Chr08g0293751 [Helianthus annuus]KAJ0709147.1 hypothetical protein HanLR1_Chr09g0337061 [Helianthus annuus]KAJ0722109.1 hypothetical protein HanOQP8_Chr08g0283011 [Helianthus annuus]KAJ0898092.1 hypothetical protein HanRHA438_Chr08g0352931 [Helianthus annuus]
MKTGWYHQPHQLYRSSLGRERNTLQKIERGKKLNYEDPILILSLPSSSHLEEKRSSS